MTPDVRAAELANAVYERRVREADAAAYAAYAADAYAAAAERQWQGERVLEVVGS